MANKKRKSTAQKIEWKSIVINGMVDFLVGFLLLLIENLISR